MTGLEPRQGLTCAEGPCALNCGGGTTDCDGLCVEVQTSDSSRGACGNACAEGNICVDGQCGLVCYGGTTHCDGVYIGAVQG